MTTKTDTQTLVLSWSGALSQLFSGHIDSSDLEGALFYFGCTREHAFNPQGSEVNELDSIAHSDPVKGLSVHLLLKQILREAEAYHRVEWRDPGDTPNFGQLNALLTRYGLPAIKMTGDRIAIGGYSLPEVHRLVAEQQLPYRIISQASFQI
jgi:hypothetical protein